MTASTEKTPEALGVVRAIADILGMIGDEERAARMLQAVIDTAVANERDRAVKILGLNCEHCGKPINAVAVYARGPERSSAGEYGHE